MKRLIASLIALTMILTLMACTGTPADKGNPEPAGGGDATDNGDAAGGDVDATGGSGDSGEPIFTIGFCMNAMDEFQSEMMEIFKTICDARNINYIITNADGKPDKQLADMETLLLQEPDLIYVFPVDPTAMKPGFQASADAGIPNMDTLGLGEENSLSIGVSAYEMGLLKNVWLERYLEENPEAVLNVGYIWGALGFAALNDRYQAFIDGIADKYPDRVNILAEQTANWSAVEAMTLMEDWMQAFPEMNTIVSQSDEMAIGAINALKGAGADFDEWHIVSFDGSPNAQNHIREGSMDATVYYAKYALGLIVIDYAERIVLGGETNLLGQHIDISYDAGFTMYLENIDELLDEYDFERIRNR